MSHPFEKVIDFNLFLSCNGAHKISLRADSCLCNACYSTWIMNYWSLLIKLQNRKEDMPREK